MRQFDESTHDVEAMEFDQANGNHNDELQYYWPEIICQSLINGQLKQAREQFKKSGQYLSDVIRHAQEYSYDVQHKILNLEE